MSNLGYGSTLSQPAVFAWRNTNFFGERFERNGLGWYNQHRVLSRLRFRRCVKKDCAPIGSLSDNGAMGRPKLFNREGVLKKALPVFWRRGFADANLHELEVATQSQ